MWIGITLVVGMLTGCSRMTGGESDIQEQVTDSEEIADTTTTEKAEDAADTEQADTETEEERKHKETARQVYAQILKHIYYQHRWPSGESMEQMTPIEDSRYVIYDVDGDGREELLVENGSGVTASQYGVIYDYHWDTGVTYIQGEMTSLTVFYSNGFMIQPLSHNQSLGSDVYPAVYVQYDKDTDSYQTLGTIETWEKAYMSENYEGQPFPDAQDLDQDGVIYYIFDKEPKTKADYEAVRQTCIGDAQELPLEWKSLDIENFQAYLSEPGPETMSDPVIVETHE